MSDITLPSRLDDVEPVRSIRTPASLSYQYMPGYEPSRFLQGVAQKKLIGLRCPKCEKVYVPARGCCPTDGIAISEPVELSDKGTVTSFCVVNVQFYGQAMELPYVSALILLDGSDIPLMHLIQETDASLVHMGQRVEAVWVPDDEIGPTLESIKYFRPTGEPDADWETYKDNV
jgi:uncharacterized OB-fold protein